MAEIIALSYEESRLQYFEELKKEHEQKLHWWKHQVPYKKAHAICDPMKIQEKCSYHGAAIQYCEDAIKALQENVRHGRWIVSVCSECGHELSSWADAAYEEVYAGRVRYCPSCGAIMDGGGK